MKARKVSYLWGVLYAFALLLLGVGGWIWLESNPYLRHLESNLRRHQHVYRMWLTARHMKDISAQKLTFSVVGQAVDAECAHGCRADAIQVYLSQDEEWVGIRWFQDGRLRRVLVASRSPQGRRSATLFLQQNKRLVGMQVSDGVEVGGAPLYDVDEWLRSGRLRTGWIPGATTPKWVVLQVPIVGETGSVPVPFFCYWEVGEDGQVQSRGLYGS